MKLLLILTAALATLSACGQKGPLYLPSAAPVPMATANAATDAPTDTPTATPTAP